MKKILFWSLLFLFSSCYPEEPSCPYQPNELRLTVAAQHKYMGTFTYLPNGSRYYCAWVSDCSKCGVSLDPSQNEAFIYFHDSGTVKDSVKIYYRKEAEYLDKDCGYRLYVGDASIIYSSIPSARLDKIYCRGSYSYFELSILP